MLTKQTIKYFRWAVRLSMICSSTPWAWDSEINRVKLIKSRAKRVQFLICFSVMIFYVLFLLSQLIRTILYPPDEKNKLASVISLSYNVLTYSVPLTIQLQILLFWTEFPSFINGYMDFFDRFQELFLCTQEKQVKNGCEKLLKTFFTLGALITMQNVVLIFRAPHRSFFLTSIVVGDKQDKPQLEKLSRILPLICVHIYIWATIWSLLLLTGCVMYSYVFPTILMVREMNYNTKSSALTKRTLRTPVMFMHMYRTLEVQQNIFNSSFKDLFIPYHKIIFSGAAVFGIYGAVKLSGVRRILMGFSAFGILLHLSVLFRRLGQLWTFSDKVLVSWQGRDRMIKRFLLSSRPLTVYISCYYIIKKTTVLNLWIVIINGSITLLLST